MQNYVHALARYVNAAYVEVSVLFLEIVPNDSNDIVYNFPPGWWLVTVVASSLECSFSGMHWQFMGSLSAASCTSLLVYGLVTLAAMTTAWASPCHAHVLRFRICHVSMLMQLLVVVLSVASIPLQVKVVFHGVVGFMI